MVGRCGVGILKSYGNVGRFDSIGEFKGRRQIQPRRWIYEASVLAELEDVGRGGGIDGLEGVGRCWDASKAEGVGRSEDAGYAEWRRLMLWL